MNKIVISEEQLNKLIDDYENQCNRVGVNSYNSAYYQGCATSLKHLKYQYSVSDNSD